MEEILDSVFKLSSREQDSTKLRGSKNIKLKFSRIFLVYPFLVFCFDFLDIKLNTNAICPKIKSFMIFSFFVILLALFWRGGGGEKVKFASISTHSGYIPLYRLIGVEIFECAKKYLDFLYEKIFFQFIFYFGTDHHYSSYIHQNFDQK